MPLLKKKADCHCASHVCDLWKKEEISKKQHLVSCQGAQSAPISKACAVILRLPSKMIYISPTQTSCCSKVIHFASCVLLHFYSLSLFFVVLMLLFLVHRQTNSRLQWLRHKNKQQQGCSDGKHIKESVPHLCVGQNILCLCVCPCVFLSSHREVSQ